MPSDTDTFEVISEITYIVNRPAHIGAKGNLYWHIKNKATIVVDTEKKLISANDFQFQMVNWTRALLGVATHHSYNFEEKITRLTKEQGGKKDV